MVDDDPNDTHLGECLLDCLGHENFLHTLFANALLLINVATLILICFFLLLRFLLLLVLGFLLLGSLFLHFLQGRFLVHNFDTLVGILAVRPDVELHRVEGVELFLPLKLLV